MKSYAVIKGNVVTNVIIAENKENVEASLNCVLVEISTENPAGIGWFYNKEQNIFIQPIFATAEE